ECGLLNRIDDRRKAQPVVDLRNGAKTFSLSAGKRRDAYLQSAPHLFTVGTDRQLQFHRTRNDVRSFTAMNRANSDNRHFTRINIARNDALQGDNERRSGDNRIDRIVRFSSVTALADDLDDSL